MEIEIDDAAEAERIAALFPTYVLGTVGPEPHALISVQTEPGGGTVRSGDTTTRCESRSDLLSTVEFKATAALEIGQLRRLAICRITIKNIQHA